MVKKESVVASLSELSVFYRQHLVDVSQKKPLTVFPQSIVFE